MGGWEVPSEEQACATAVRRVSTKSANTTVWRREDDAPPELRVVNEATLALRVRPGRASSPPASSAPSSSSSSMLGMGSTPLPAEVAERFSLVMSARSDRKLSIVSVQILSMMEREVRADWIHAPASGGFLASDCLLDSAIWDSVLRVDSRGVIRSRAMQAITLDRSAARAIRSLRRLTMASMTRAANSLRFCFSIRPRPSGRVLVSMMHRVPSL
mmetsp:Transcript_7607/g.21187  ORF Transcript_7607/g.21187 Transcript_7607/m.21187 type:complete len:215 (+) Transcript_7607:2021-2665(+)